MFANRMHTSGSYVSDSFQCLCLYLCLLYFVRVLSPVLISFFPLSLHSLSDPLVYCSSLNSILSLPFPCLSVLYSSISPHCAWSSILRYICYTVYAVRTYVYTYKIHTVRYLSREIVCECKIRYPIIRKWFFE